jgi:predicted membrane chloride channel (bestrophin family)
MKEKIYNFFEKPKGVVPNVFQGFIVVLILMSVGIIVLEVFYHAIFKQYETYLIHLNHFILAVFTVEYVLRLATAPQKLKFAVRPMNIVDFLAVFPNYLEFFLHVFIDTTELRALRLIRLLRFTRMLRLLKLFRYGNLFKKVFQFQGTILEAIFPVLLIFIGIKGVIWTLEHFHLWIPLSDLGELFAIIGFALGIILSQKIGVSYDKFLQVEQAIIRIYGNLESLKLIGDKIRKSRGSKVAKVWAKEFLTLLIDPVADNSKIHAINYTMFEQAKIDPDSEVLTGLYREITQDAAFCLSKKVRLTPKAYDTLLHQATMLYLALIAIFIPGITGLISIMVATYILYGMYNLTQDFDSIFGGEFNLINIDMTELELLVKD